MRRKPKLEIIYEFRKKRAELLKKEFKGAVDQQQALLELAKSYLANYPELEDPDCRGIGLPAYYVESLTTSLQA